MEKNKSKKRKKLILILLIIAIALSGYFISDRLTIVEVEELNMFLTVGEFAGFNVGTEALFFGTIPQGGSGSRDLILSNNYMFPVKVDIRAFGELAKWAYVSDNGFLLKSNENKTVKVSAVVPKDADFGNYTSILKIIFRKI